MTLPLTPAASPVNNTLMRAYFWPHLRDSRHKVLVYGKLATWFIARLSARQCRPRGPGLVACAATITRRQHGRCRRLRDLALRLGAWLALAAAAVLFLFMS